jgi:hypothetical protein
MPTQYRTLDIDLYQYNGRKFELQVSPNHLVLVEIGGQKATLVLASRVKPRKAAASKNGQPGKPVAVKED